MSGTELEEARRQIERLSRDAEAARRELDALVYSVSHDLRAPLRAILGFYQIFMEDYHGSVPADGLQVLERVDTGARRLAAMLESLLTLSRVSRHAMSVESLDLDALVGRVAHAVQAPQDAQTTRRIELNIDTLGECSGDQALITDLFERLLSNAKKFSRSRDPAVIQVGRRTEGTETIYFVRDNGVGFKMEYASKLFGVFQRMHAEAEFEGTGIGLALAQRIVHRHGGRIWAESAPGSGATFHFTLAPPSQ